MYREVPEAPESADIFGIPPVLVEVSVSKVQKLGHCVEERVE